MRTSKCVTISLIVALAATAALGQDQPAARSQTAPRSPSNTRQASCLVRITVDPAIMPLNGETLSSLVYSPAVLLKAVRDVLSLRTPQELERLNKPQSSGRPVVIVKWLNTSSTSMSPGERALPRNQGARIYDDEQMRRQLEKAYGPAYVERMMRSSDQADGSSPTDSVTDPSRRNQPPSDRVDRGSFGTSGMGAGGVGGMEQSGTIGLDVSLPEDVLPAAEELLTALVQNLKGTLFRAYDSYITDVDHQLVAAREYQQSARRVLDETAGETSAATTRIRKQLEVEVDLSVLKPETPFKEAVEVLRKSVVPPLNIVVFWTDVKYQLSIEPTTPISIDGLPQVKMGTALDLLVKGLTRDAKLMWRIKDDTIVIGTAATLGQPIESGGQPRVETDAVNLGGQRSELVRKIQGLELDLAGMDARREAIGTQIAGVRQRVSEKLSQDPVTQELEKLARMHGTSVVKDAEGRPVSRETPNSESAIRARIELANRREELSKQVGGGQLEEFNKELSRLAIDKAEKEAQLQIVRKQLDQVQRELAQALAFVPEAARVRMAQEALDLAGRRVTELQTRLASVQPPMVTMIGAN
jgi:hypothetical protein